MTQPSPPTDPYKEIAADFDRLTRFDDRIERERPIFEALLKEHGWRKVVDAGCGSGLHAVLLAQLGVEVVGIDISEAMLERAKENASRYGVTVKFVQSDLAAAELQGQYDAVISLGNTFALLLGADTLESVLHRFHSWLRPGGNLLVQMLNFERILGKRRRLIAANEVDDTIFVRYYDFSGPLLRFNLLRLRDGDSDPSQGHTTSDHYPWQRKELMPALKKHGFSASFWGDLKQTPFDPDESDNLVIFASRD